MLTTNWVKLTTNWVTKKHPLTTNWVKFNTNNLICCKLFIIFAATNQYLRVMKQVLNTLKRIEHDANKMGKTIRNEGQVWRAELEERQRMGLQGDAAIKHYNEWMQRYGMEHLMVKEG